MGSESIDPSGEYPEGISLKSCTGCRTTKTPLWRGGPSGPKSLCNACGIKYRKKKREMLGFKDVVSKEKKDEKKKNSNIKKKRSCGGGDGSKMSVFRLLGFGMDVLLNQRSMLRLRRRRRLAEEEEAAVLLMALSCGLL